MPISHERVQHVALAVMTLHRVQFAFLTFALKPIRQIVTYVLLCGYSPFRSDNPKELFEETMAANIEFHDKFWRNVSDEGKEFIKSLLNPNPRLRPTIEEILDHHILDTHPPLLFLISRDSASYYGLDSDEEEAVLMPESFFIRKSSHRQIHPSIYEEDE